MANKKFSDFASNADIDVVVGLKSGANSRITKAALKTALGVDTIESDITTIEGEITTIEGQQTTQDAAIALNTAKRTYPLVDEQKLATIEIGAEVNPTNAEIVTSVNTALGQTTWQTQTTPAGSNGQIQFNNSGAFGASSSLTFVGGVLQVQGLGSDKTSWNVRLKNLSGLDTFTFLNSATLKIGHFTVGGGVTNEALITEGILRAAGGLNLRSPIVGDSAFSGVRLSVNDVVIAVSNSNVATLSANGTIGTYAIRTNRSYNAVVGVGDIANNDAYYNAPHSTGSADFGAYHTRPLINQTGTSTSKYYGYKCIPAITALVSDDNWRSLWLEAYAGFNIYAKGTARNYIQGNIGIGTETCAASAILDVTSTTQGVLFPRMTTAQRTAIPSPATGLVVYDTTLNKLCVYTTVWEIITSA